HLSPAGFISSEVGPQAVTYGWLESVRTGIPCVDAPCNGRAHPLGLMGSLCLHRYPSYRTTAVGVGGNPGTRRRVELIVHANVQQAARILRRAGAQAGISLAVVRNPLPVAYVRKNAAVGALRYATKVGKVLLRTLPAGLSSVLNALKALMG